MPGKLQAEIRQSRLFERPEEALLNVVRTADALARNAAAALKPFAVTPTQYNVLRILRGAGEDGRTCREISERMLTRDPDVTRMLDRLESRRLVRRHRDAEDRRVVRTQITVEGLDLLRRADPIIAALNQRLAGHLDQVTLRTLIEALEEIRERAR